MSFPHAAARLSTILILALLIAVVAAVGPGHKAPPPAEAADCSPTPCLALDMNPSTPAIDEVLSTDGSSFCVGIVIVGSPDDLYGWLLEVTYDQTKIDAPEAGSGTDANPDLNDSTGSAIASGCPGGLTESGFLDEAGWDCDWYTAPAGDTDGNHADADGTASLTCINGSSTTGAGTGTIGYILFDVTGDITAGTSLEIQNVEVAGITMGTLGFCNPDSFLPMECQGGTAMTAACSPSPCLAIDMDPSTLAIDSVLATNASTFCVGVVMVGSPAAITSFAFDVLYDQTMIDAPEVAGATFIEDDNPDLNNLAGSQLATGCPGDPGPSESGFLEEVGWDCTLVSPPMEPEGDIDGNHADATGTARLGCTNASSTLDAGTGALGYILFNVTGDISSGTALQLQNASVYGTGFTEIGSCEPVLTTAMVCQDGTATTLTSLDGFWHISYTGGSANAYCALTVNQTDAFTISGPISCTDATIGTNSGTLDQVANTSDTGSTFSVPFGLATTATGDFNEAGTAWSGDWVCVAPPLCPYFGEFSGTKYTDTYSEEITAATDESITTELGDELFIPAGALDYDATVQIELVPLTIPPPAATLPFRTGYSFTFIGGTPTADFDPPMEMTFNYTPEDLPRGSSVYDLRLYNYDETLMAWVDEGTPYAIDDVPPVTTITYLITHFSVRRLFDTDYDGDGVADGGDNCEEQENGALEALIPGVGDQTNVDTSAIDNGPGVPAVDDTVPNGDPLGDACDDDDDNDGRSDVDETDGGGCGGVFTDPRGDITNDDDGDGNPAPGDTGDDGPSWDSDNDGARDGYECANGTNPLSAASKPAVLSAPGPGVGPHPDSDGDGLPDNWEERGWGTLSNDQDSDDDGVKDCKEAADIDGDNKVLSTVDFIAYAYAVFKPTNVFGKTMDFDIDKSGSVLSTTDFIWMAKVVFNSGVFPCL